LPILPEKGIHPAGMQITRERERERERERKRGRKREKYGKYRNA